jgi:MEMO1 family protein
MIRRSAVAGQFYQASPEKLRKQVEDCLDPAAPKQKAIAIVVPHAGLIYSGLVAGSVYSRVVLPPTLILIGPNHTGLGCPISVFPKGEWEMPNGRVRIDQELAEAVMEGSPHVERDVQAHLYEHCLEVHLPFLQYFLQNFKIVPILMMRGDLEVCQELGRTLAGIVRGSDAPILLIASTDMTHYESDRSAREKDWAAIDQILNLDAAGLYRVVKERQISMCGYAPTVTVLAAAIELGAAQTDLIRYMTSGEVSRDYSHVVGYAGIIIA